MQEYASENNLPKNIEGEDMQCLHPRNLSHVSFFLTPEEPSGREEKVQQGVRWGQNDPEENNRQHPNHYGRCRKDNPTVLTPPVLELFFH